MVCYDNDHQSQNMRWRLALPYEPPDNPDPNAKSFLVSSSEPPHYTCTQVSVGMDRPINLGT